MKPTVKAFLKILRRIQVREDSCWIWNGSIGKDGYGRSYVSYQDGTHGKTVAHKIVYETLVDYVPGKMTLDHLCRNRNCVNPYHLEIVTRKENVLRGIGLAAQNVVKTHCKRGHPFTGENLRFGSNPGGRVSRLCAECIRIRGRANYYRNYKYTTRGPYNVKAIRL